VPFEIVAFSSGAVEQEKEKKAAGNKLSPRIGIAGGVSGMIAGLIQLSAGGRLRNITGHEDDHFILGLITIILSIFSLYCIYHAERGTSKDITRRTAPLIGIWIPALVCFNTAGLLWFLPGALLIASIVLFSLELRREIRNSGDRYIPEIPRWKRLLIASGVILAVSPVLVGWVLDPLSLAVHEDDYGSYSIKPMDKVEHEHLNGTVTGSEVTGVMMVHGGLLIGGGMMLVGGQLGSKPITIGGGALSLVMLLFFLIMAPVILFNEGAEIEHFSGEHFRALSWGFLLSLIGIITVMVSRLLGEGTHGEREAGV